MWTPPGRRIGGGRVGHKDRRGFVRWKQRPLYPVLGETHNRGEREEGVLEEGFLAVSVSGSSTGEGVCLYVIFPRDVGKTYRYTVDCRDQVQR